MKNYISATFFLTLLTVGALLGLYFLPSMKLDGEQLRKVDLLADIRPDVKLLNSFINPYSSGEKVR